MKTRLTAVSIVIVLTAVGVVTWRTWRGTDVPSSSGLSGNGTKTNSAEDEDEFTELDEVKQQYIWDLEHATFEVETHMGKPFTAALRDRDAQRIKQFCTDDFIARLPSGEPNSIVEKSGVREQAWTEMASETDGVDAGQFGADLVARLSKFQSINNARLRVLHIDADADDINSGRWTLRLLLTASGRTADDRDIFFRQECDAVCRFHADDEVVAGKILESWVADKTVLSDSRPLMQERTKQYGLDRLKIPDNWKSSSDQVQQYTARMACEDFNRDGHVDLAVVAMDGHGYVLASREGRSFTDVTKSLGIPRMLPKGSASLVTWLDFDNDGFPDLLFGGDLYHNIEGRKFQRVDVESRLRLAMEAWGCVVADYDCDGLLDIYVLYQSRLDSPHQGKLGWIDDDVSGAENQLWKNLGGGRFEDVTRTTRTGGGTRHSFAATWLHANDDHHPDLYLANDFARNSLFINQGDGTFRDVGESSGTADFATSMGVASGDIDGDGRSEIYVANMYSKMGRRIIAHVGEEDYPPQIYDRLKGACAGNRMYRRTGDGQQYEEISDDLGVNAVGWAYAPSLADFDADGFLDIYATTGFLSFRRDKPDG